MNSSFSVNSASARTTTLQSSPAAAVVSAATTITTTTLRSVATEPQSRTQLQQHPRRRRRRSRPNRPWTQTAAPKIGPGSGSSAVRISRSATMHATTTSASDALRLSKEERRRQRRQRRVARRQQQQLDYGLTPAMVLQQSSPPPYTTLPMRGAQYVRGQVVNQNSTNNAGNWRHSVLPMSASELARNASRPPPFFLDEQQHPASSPTSATPGGVMTSFRDLIRANLLGVPNVSHASVPLATAQQQPDPSAKRCCGIYLTHAVSIRWFIVMVAFVGVCCSVVGTVLGALKASGHEHLTVSLLMIGVGIVLITVSGVAWRLTTTTEAPSCRALLGLGDHPDEEDQHNGLFLRPSNCPAGHQGGNNNNNNSNNSSSQMANGRVQHPYAAMMYSDFNYRPPPPSYQASMQEYRLRLLLMDRQPGSHGPGLALSPPPPPPYRAQLRNATANALAHSRPPSYKSHMSDPQLQVPVYHHHHSQQHDQSDQTGGNTITRHDTPGSSPASVRLSSTSAIVHTFPRDRSESGTTRDDNHVVSVPVVHQHAKTDLESKRDQDNFITDKIKITGINHHDDKCEKVQSNLVTIVQTGNNLSSTSSSAESSTSDSSEVMTPESSVIVTVSGSVHNEAQRTIRTSPGEVQILAHL